MTLRTEDERNPRKAAWRISTHLYLSVCLSVYTAAGTHGGCRQAPSVSHRTRCAGEAPGGRPWPLTAAPAPHPSPHFRAVPNVSLPESVIQCLGNQRRRPRSLSKHRRSRAPAAEAWSLGVATKVSRLRSPASGTALPAWEGLQKERAEAGPNQALLLAPSSGGPWPTLRRLPGVWGWEQVHCGLPVCRHRDRAACWLCSRGARLTPPLGGTRAGAAWLLVPGSAGPRRGRRAPPGTYSGPRQSPHVSASAGLTQLLQAAVK